VQDSSTPKPEALYVDSRTGESLVIERKTISWPSDYPRRHANDHFLVNRILEALPSSDLPNLYSLRLTPLIEGTQPELRAFAKTIVGQIRAHLSDLKEGQSIGSKKPGRAWAFYIRTPEEREDWEGAARTSLLFTWNDSGPDYIDPACLPSGLLEKIDAIYAGCKRKFIDYSEARRILLLHPHGRLFSLPTWWREVFRGYPPPSDIQEIWLAEQYDEPSLTWSFENVHSNIQPFNLPA
jgi:hypothetical protein